MAAMLTPWDAAHPPTAEEIERIFQREGLRPTWWSNGPGEKYALHDHPWDKLLFCLWGEIEFRLESGEVLAVRPGDRLELAAGTPHSARAGAAGVRCAEAYRD
jgi:quercetin dioxygenase-like cupin family protein